MQKYLERDTTYLSHRSIAELLRSLGAVQQRKAFATVRSAPFFSVTADGSTDISGKQQFAVFGRVVKEGAAMSEDIFVSLRELKGKNARAHADRLEEVIGDIGSSRKRLASISMDGARVMAGKNSGTQLRIRTLMQPSSIFIWCLAHSLNLSAIDSATGYVSTFFSCVRSAWVYFQGSRKRHEVLREKLTAMQDVCNYNTNVLGDCVDTRWLSRGSSTLVL